MKDNVEKQPWDGFQYANHQRRAIRQFNDAGIDEAEIMELLNEARLSPSSVNLQPYQLHWIRQPDLKKRVAEACNGQKAAATAAEIVVVVASTAFARDTIFDQLVYVDGSTSMPADSKDYHRKQLKKFDQILKLGGWPLWTPFVSLLALFRPSLSLLPLGHLGSRHWAARNAVFAAQTIMLAAATKGIDSCPMEGVSASKLSQLLELPRGAVIPVVIALGHRAAGARVEEQWRRSTENVVYQH